MQAEGYFLGYYFYFRSRGTVARIEFAASEEVLWDRELYLAQYELWHTRVEGAAGWLPYWFCRVLIWWGCLRFIFERRGNEPYDNNGCFILNKIKKK